MLSLKAFFRLIDGVVAVQALRAPEITACGSALAAVNGAPKNALVVRSYSLVSREWRTPADRVQIGMNSKSATAQTALMGVCGWSSMVRRKQPVKGRVGKGGG